MGHLKLSLVPLKIFFLLSGNSCRGGVNSRAMGWTLIFIELLVFCVPISVMQFMPNFYLGALLVWCVCVYYVLLRSAIVIHFSWEK